jgi:hypothetical protein
MGVFMKRSILFRFHQYFTVCEAHLHLIRLFNPTTPIYGLYGGPARDAAQAHALPLEHVFTIPLDDPYWKWAHGDLAIRWWYQEVGYRWCFDMLHVMEWDFLLLAAIDTHFAHIRDGVALTDVKPLATVYDTSNWLAPKRGRDEWLSLKSEIDTYYSYRAEPVIGFFPGVVLSRAFLERYASVETSSLCNDEVRVPLFAQAFGMAVHDTGLASDTFIVGEKRTVAPEVVSREYERGVRAFHPVREPLDDTTVRRLRSALRHTPHGS